MPAVSVVIPTHNRANLLRIAIGSVLNQTFTDYEIIVVDDASEDDTESVVREFGDSRIRYARHPVNRRIASARNTGVTQSTGAYIAFLDDDDEWLPTKLERQVDILNASATTVGAVYTAFEQVDLTTREIVRTIRPRKRGHILHELCLSNWIGTASTVCLRRQCFEEVGLFDEQIEFGEEYDLWIRIAHTFDFRYIDDVLVRYGVHPCRLSTNYQVMINGLESQLRKYRSFFAADPVNLSRRYAALGRLYCYNGESKKGRRAFQQAARVSPVSANNYPYLVLSLLGGRAVTAVERFKNSSKR